MTRGTLIEYSIRLHGIPIRWRSQITEWDPPHSFVDTQINGPYKIWVHHHLFEARAGGTVMQDIVKYSIPGSILEPLIHFLFVKRELDRIFNYREESLLKIFSKC
jgi:ligand-binding SRPBCC domain-containing protein